MKSQRVWKSYWQQLKWRKKYKRLKISKNVKLNLIHNLNQLLCISIMMSILTESQSYFPSVEYERAIFTFSEMDSENNPKWTHTQDYRMAQMLTQS